ADQRAFEQPNDRRQHLVTRQLGEVDVPLDALTDERQDLAEGDHPAELRLVAHLAVSWVVSILLPSSCVARGNLQMSRRVRANPHVIPLGGNDELSDSLELRLVANHGTV